MGFIGAIKDFLTGGNETPSKSEPVVVTRYVRNELIPTQTDLYELVLFLNTYTGQYFGVEPNQVPVGLAEWQFNHLPEQLKKYFDRSDVTVL